MVINYDFVSEEDSVKDEVGTLDAMNVYKDATGLFVTKNHTGMCGTEYRNIYFKNDKIIEIDGHTYKLVASHKKMVCMPNCLNHNCPK